MKIGNTELEYGLILAPMAGFTDRAMRLVANRCGAEYGVTEMVSAKAVCYGDKKTHTLARIMSDEGPCALQIFGKEPNIMAQAAAILEAGEENSSAPVAIDINMGCPVNKIFSNGEGSALMKNPGLIYDIVKAVSEAIHIPCTVKLRAGVDKDSINAVECAIAAEEGGAQAVTVHGRTRAEMYSGKANCDVVKNVKNGVHIPVIASGDIVDLNSFLEVREKTGADAFMIGRGAIGNPFIFSEIKAYLSKEKYELPTLSERIEMALCQLKAAVLEKGETVAVRESRKQIALYLHAFKGASQIRAKVNRAESYSEIEVALYSVLEEKL